MSSKKEKLLDNAQKFLVKGQLDRALREYEQAVTIDPKDVRVRQKYAELLVRANRKEEALKEFEVIGKYYSDNGFYLKAIAVYKQIQKITPSNLDISLTLGTLNEKQGLIGNALAEYKFVFDQYERSNRYVEAVAVLEKMLAADRENLNIRQKLADTRHRAGFFEDAYRDYTELARDFRSRGDESAYRRICERIGNLFPDRKDFLLSVAENHIKDGNPAIAIPILKGLVGDDRWNPKALYLLADAARTAGDLSLTRGAYGQIVKRFPVEIPAIKGFLFSLRAEGNVEEGVKVLRRLESHLLATEPETLEQFYLSFRDLAPDHPGITDGLRRVREAAGLEVESSEELEQMAEPTSVVTPLVETEEAPRTAGEDLSLEESTDDEIPWEEEIEVSVVDRVISLEGNVPTYGETQECSQFLQNKGTDLINEDERAVRFDGSLSDEGHEVEVELADFPGIADDWLRGTGDGTTVEPAEVTAGEGHSLDFTDDELADLIPSPQLESPAQKTDKYGLDGFFSAFKKGVGEQLAQDDTESHYSLGIAYKEMGLFDDAIAEFQAAARDPLRRVDCITLQGICSREKGDSAGAEDFFQSGLRLGELTTPGRLCLTYELALLYENTGRVERALSVYREVFSLNPDFRDTRKKIARLGSGDALETADLELVDLDELEEELG